MTQPLQSIVSKGEQFALTLVPFVKAGQLEEAGIKLIEFAKENKITRWEMIAIADIAKAIATGRKWKKET